MHTVATVELEPTELGPLDTVTVAPINVVEERGRKRGKRDERSQNSWEGGKNR